MYVAIKVNMFSADECIPCRPTSIKYADKVSS